MVSDLNVKDQDLQTSHGRIIANEHVWWRWQCFCHVQKGHSYIIVCDTSCDSLLSMNMAINRDGH